MVVSFKSCGRRWGWRCAGTLAGISAALSGVPAFAGADPVLAERDALFIPVAIRQPARDSQAGETVAIPSPEELQQMRAIIGSVAIDVEDIFDVNDPRESSLLYRRANDLHIATRESTVREQLLFQSGEEFSAQRAEETARLLRARGYLTDAEVSPSRYDPVTNTVDIKMKVHDVWTVEPGVGFGRSGGSNSSRIRLAN